MRRLYSLIGLLLAVNIQAQEALSFEDALALTLENNYDIRISRINEQVAENNAERQANGYLPTVNTSGAYSWTYFESTNTLRTGEQSFDPNSSYNYNAAITLSYTLFDGLGRKYRYQQAANGKVLSSLELQTIMESAVLQLSQFYHEVARLKQQTQSLDSTVYNSVQRVKRAQYGYEYGQFTQLDVLNAQVDLDTDSINLMNSRQQLENTKRSLNLVMGVPVETVYEIQEAVQLISNMSAEEVVNSALEKGSRVLTAEQQQRIAELGIGANKSAWLPNIGVNGGYQYRGIDDPNGAFLLSNNSLGPTATINLNWNLFDGRNNVQMQNAKLQLESSNTALERTKEQVRTEALNTHGAYLNALFVLQARESNVNTARNNFQRSEESFKLSQITSVEFRQAQLNLLNSELLLSQALYEAKNIELQMLGLMGELIK
ncbi:MAG: TolC family protein [Bacteroidetes bacterium]|nr:TolC family protein [Bacteroidota bacterium]